MATTHIIDKVKNVAQKAKAIQEACDAFINDPNLQEVTDLFNMLNAFSTGQPKPPKAVEPPRRKRRTREEIEAEEAAKGSGKPQGEVK